MTTVYEALAAVMEDVSSVAKTGRNERQNFSFRGIDAVVNAVGPALRKHKVIVVPEVRSYDYGTVEVGGNRTQMGHVRVEVAYTFYGPEGDSIPTVVPGEAMDAGDKATAKAMSVAFRTALLQALALPTDEADPDSHSYERSAVPEPQQSSPPPTVDDLLRDVGKADSADALNAVAFAAVNLASAGHLLEPEFKQVREAVTARRALLTTAQTPPAGAADPTATRRRAQNTTEEGAA